MPLPLPRLGDRRFDQLVDEGKALLPRLAPGWTDYNLHDPGITLIDLFAWLVEMDLYRLDRTSPAAYRAFLRLVGIEPRPPQVAETVLVFSVVAGNPAATVPAGALCCECACYPHVPDHPRPRGIDRSTGVRAGRIGRIARSTVRHRTKRPADASRRSEATPNWEGPCIWVSMRRPLPPARK